MSDELEFLVDGGRSGLLRSSLGLVLRHHFWGDMREHLLSQHWEEVPQGCLVT